MNNSLIVFFNKLFIAVQDKSYRWKRFIKLLCKSKHKTGLDVKLDN